MHDSTQAPVLTIEETIHIAVLLSGLVISYTSRAGQKKGLTAGVNSEVQTPVLQRGVPLSVVVVQLCAPIANWT